MTEDNFEAELQEAVLPIVDDLMQQQIPPPDLLIPEAVWKKNVRQELIDVCTGKQIRNRVTSAQKLIIEDLKAHLTSLEFEQFQVDWKKEMSEVALSHIYDVGIRHYKAKHFSKAADIFFFMTLLDDLRHNIWISLGLSEQQNGHFELALAAFNMAIMTNSDNPVSYLQAAECSLAERNASEAKQYLELAKEAIEKSATRQKFLDQLHHLEQRSKL